MPTRARRLPKCAGRAGRSVETLLKYYVVHFYIAN